MVQCHLKYLQTYIQVAVWHGGLGRPGSAGVVCWPPHIEKNKLFLNEYLGIFRAYFFIFLNLENGLFQTPPPTKSGKFQIFFFEPFPYVILESLSSFMD